MENLKIVDYVKTYANEIDKLESSEWEADGIQEQFENGSIIRVALINDKIVGTIYGKATGDLFTLNILIIEQNYRNMGIGTKLLNNLLELLKNQNIKNVLVQAVFSNNKINIEALMKKFNFKETLRVKGWWGTKHPNTTCKICKNKPCICTCIFYLKEL